MLVRFIKVERNAALLLIIAGLLGLLLSNLTGASIVSDQVAEVSHYSLCLFFFLVGLELKRELTGGVFKNKKSLLVPLLAAVFGALIPAIIYFIVTANSPAAQNGWAIPMATDITFALAVFSFFARKFSKGARGFLLAFAIIDDILAILVIALFLGAPVLTGALVTGSALLGLLIPTKNIAKLENLIHPFVAYVVLPLFAFTALSLPIGISVGSVLASVVGVGILLRVIGKIAGISFGAWLGVRLFRIDSDLKFRDYFQISILGGIGFTVSLLVTDLVFIKGSVEHSQAVVASLLAALLASVLASIAYSFRVKSLT
ncbi:MAG: Na+/H+ antiporter NhaA [Actinomycetes bacterium]